jgi:hypothetical protein
VDAQREIGILIEQGRWLAKEIGEMKKDIRDIKHAHLSLLTEHWRLYAKVLGLSMVTSLITAGIIEILTKH